MEDIFAIIVGIAIIVLGILNCKGNISMVHSYHTKRVKEEDKRPFGRLMGIGSIIIGVSVIIMASLSLIATNLQNVTFNMVGVIVLIVGLIIGIAIIVYALFKYNKGIF